MKRSTILCASVVALVAFAMSAEGAFATDSVQSRSSSHVRANGMTTAPKPSSGGPKHPGDSRVNSELDNVNESSSDRLKGGPKHQVLNPAGSGGARTK
jgi:hypothetical protein